MRFRPTIVVLAASLDRRPLLEQPYQRGTVLGITISNAVQSQLPVLVVTTGTLAALAQQHVAQRDVCTISEDSAALGVSQCIAAGVAERSGSAGWLLVPGDMPLIQPGTLLAVATALETHAVVHAEHHGRRGFPVGFAGELYSELVKLQGDDDARRIIARYPAYGLELADPGVVFSMGCGGDVDPLDAQLGNAKAVAKLS